MYRLRNIVVTLTASLLATTLISQTHATNAPKAGTVTFARLDTSISSEHSSDRVMATIIDGRYKGTRLVGQLITSKGKTHPSVVHFTSLIPSQSKHELNINAYGIDFDTARTIIITEVDYDYLRRNIINLASALTESYATSHKIKMGAGTDIGIMMM